MSDEEPRAESDEQPARDAQPDVREVEAADTEDVQPGELTPEETKGVVEALLFAASEPLSPAALARLCGIHDGRALRQIVEELKAEYARQRRAFTVEETAGGYQLMTLPELHPWVSKLREDEHEKSLSQASLETLAIVAYKQPITRAEIEDVRGVQSGYILRSLIEKGLVRVTGRSDQLGHPLLYGTSHKFLEVFGLASLDALPTLDELEPPASQQQG